MRRAQQQCLKFNPKSSSTLSTSNPGSYKVWCWHTLKGTGRSTLCLPPYVSVRQEMPWKETLVTYAKRRTRWSNHLLGRVACATRNNDTHTHTLIHIHYHFYGLHGGTQLSPRRIHLTRFFFLHTKICIIRVTFCRGIVRGIPNEVTIWW